jgi:hypothetical protein
LAIFMILIAVKFGLLGICFRARRTGDGENGTGVGE